MWPKPQFPADLVTFTEEIFNGKLHILRNVDNLEHPIMTPVGNKVDSFSSVWHTTKKFVIIIFIDHLY